MNAILPTFTSVDDFLRWSQQQEQGRYELEKGRIIVTSRQNAEHAKTKVRVFNLLQAAIVKAHLPLYAMPDGMSVRITDDRAYEPDALVAALPEVAGKALEIPNPVIVVEVLSPTPASQKRDLTVKVEGYGRVATIEHYIIVDPAERQVLHYRREGRVLAPPAAPSEGILHLDPPGLGLPVAAIFDGTAA